MAIPRLPPSADDLVVTITINKRLRPYLIKWFNALKEDDDSPNTFTERVLMNEAIKWYARKNETDKIEAHRLSNTEDVLDEPILITEVE